MPAPAVTEGTIEFRGYPVWYRTLVMADPEGNEVCFAHSFPI